MIRACLLLVVLVVFSEAIVLNAPVFPSLIRARRDASDFCMNSSQCPSSADKCYKNSCWVKSDLTCISPLPAYRCPNVNMMCWNGYCYSQRYQH